MKNFSILFCFIILTVSLSMAQKKENTLNINGKAKYTGETKNNQAHGKGIYYYENAEYYQGEFTFNHRTGKGKFYFSNGETYEGEFLNGEMHGDGIYTYIDGSTLKCSWISNKRNGECSKISTTGEEQVVNYFNDKKQN